MKLDFYINLFFFLGLLRLVILRKPLCVYQIALICLGGIPLPFTAPTVFSGGLIPDTVWSEKDVTWIQNMQRQNSWVDFHCTYQELT